MNHKRTIVIGLTGGIATGKSTVAALLKDKGACIFDADAVVHDMLLPDGLVYDVVKLAFPDAIEDGMINRAKLGKYIFSDPTQRKRLEAIIHPRVQQKEDEFIRDCKIEAIRYAVLEIPLLFETGTQHKCDITVTTECPAEVQIKRAMQRPHMTMEKLQAILASQMPQAERRALADWVIPTGMHLSETEESVNAMLRALET